MDLKRKDAKMQRKIFRALCLRVFASLCCKPVANGDCYQLKQISFLMIQSAELKILSLTSD